MDKIVYGVIGGLLTILMIMVINGRAPIPRSDVAECATGQNLSLRDTAGIAVYTVRFKDGEAVEFKCSRPAVK